MEVREKPTNEEGESEDEEFLKEEDGQFYEWNMIPITYPEERQNGVTFKGDTEEYFEASKKILNMMKVKGMNYVVNGREIRILDNLESKPIKVQIKPKKGLSGKVNVRIYGVNKQGHATMMIQKVSGGNMNHVKAVAFGVMKYLLDGIIDGEIDNDEIENMKSQVNCEKDQTRSLVCVLFVIKLVKQLRG